MNRALVTQIMEILHNYDYKKSWSIAAATSEGEGSPRLMIIFPNTVEPRLTDTPQRWTPVI